MQQCTVVSIAPFDILETKPSIIPSTYFIPACKEKFKPSVLVINSAKGAVQLPAQEMTFAYLVPAEDIAKDIVGNLISSQLEYSLESHAGIFWVDGAHASQDIPKKFPEEFKKADEVQFAWFKKLVVLADNDWAVTKSSRSITNIQKSAARALGLKRDWIDVVDSTISLMDCPFCGTKILSDVAMCYNCKQTVNQAKYNELTKKVS